MKIRFTAPDMILLLVILQIIMHFIFPIIQIINYPYTYFGILLIIIGQIPNVWIYFYFKKVKTSLKIHEKPKKLVTLGLLRISRNPNYLGMAVTLFGVAILLGSLIAFIFPISFIIWTNSSVIPLEEKNLEKAFGKKYLAYKKRVRKWI